MKRRFRIVCPRLCGDQNQRNSMRHQQCNFRILSDATPMLFRYLLLQGNRISFIYAHQWHKTLKTLARKQYK